MRILICLLALAVTLTCCKSNKRMIRSEVGYVSTQPVEVAVQEKVQDTLIVEEEPVTVKKEKVGLTDGADLMRYCIIVGSFGCYSFLFFCCSRLMNDELMIPVGMAIMAIPIRLMRLLRSFPSGVIG